MIFRDSACAHLANYKLAALNIKGDGIFRYRGKNIPKSHILPKSMYTFNILEEYRSQFFSSTYGNIKLHQFFHHLNSSQALCINLNLPHYGGHP